MIEQKNNFITFFLSLFSVTTWMILFFFVLSQMLLLKYLPGNNVSGSPTPNKVTPTFKDNGPLGLLFTVTLYLVFSYGLNLFSPTIFCDYFRELICSFFLLCISFSLWLALPSNSKQIKSKGFWHSFLWGKELYPRIWGLDIKQLITSRLAMTSWALIVISFLSKAPLSNTLLVTCLLQLLFIIKFFFFEKDHLRSVSITQSNMGFWLSLNSFFFIPAIYPLPAAILMNHPLHLSHFLAALLFFSGLATLFISYLTEAQKSTLSISGFWRLSRHFDLFLEMLLALFWALPSLSHIEAYLFLFFVFSDFTIKAKQLESHNLKKFGIKWRSHCKKVPYLLIPYLY